MTERTPGIGDVVRFKAGPLRFFPLEVVGATPAGDLVLDVSADLGAGRTIPARPQELEIFELCGNRGWRKG